MLEEGVYTAVCRVFLELCAFMIEAVSSIEQKKSELRYSDVVSTVVLSSRALSGVWFAKM